MAGEEQRITVGLRGQSLPLRVAPQRVAELIESLRGGQGGWYELSTEDGSVHFDLAKVEYVRIDAHEQRVGFGL